MEDSEQTGNTPDNPSGGLGTEISGLFAKVGLYSDIPELRGHEVKPASFEESLGPLGVLGSHPPDAAALRALRVWLRTRFPKIGSWLPVRES